MPEQVQSSTAGQIAEAPRSRIRMKGPEWGALLIFLLAEIVFFTINSPIFCPGQISSTSSPRCL